MFNRRSLQQGGSDCQTNVFDTAKLNPDLSIATTLIELAGLTDIFSCAGPFTALIPNNAAFDDVDQDFLDSLVLPSNSQMLRNLLLYHILPGATRDDEFPAGPTGTLFDGIQVDVTLNPLEFDGRDVQTTNVQACNGYIHILGAMLDPFEVCT